MRLTRATSTPKQLLRHGNSHKATTTSSRSQTEQAWINKTRVAPVDDDVQTTDRERERDDLCAKVLRRFRVCIRPQVSDGVYVRVGVCRR